MKGVVFLGGKELELMTFDDPTPGPGEVVLEMKASGMCGSDLRYYRRPKEMVSDIGLPLAVGPVIAGHEPCGVVVAVGPGAQSRTIREGARMMVHHYHACGECGQCRTGWTQLCRTQPIAVYGSNHHGGHAKYIKVAASSLVPLPEELSYAVGAAISCGTGTAFGALERMKLSGGDTIAIFGQGAVGLSATKLAAAMGMRVIALDISESRLQSAKQMGAAEVLDPSKVDPVEAIRELTRGDGAAGALDTSASHSARLACLHAIRTWGTVCYVGEGGELKLDVSKDILRKQLTLVGSWTFSIVGQARCAQFIVDKSLDFEEIFTDRWSLEQASEAYALFDQQAGGKGVFLS